jgi:hypothetical protein
VQCKHKCILLLISRIIALFLLLKCLLYIF